MQLLPRVIGLWRGRLLWTIHIRWRGLRTAVWKALSYFVENCSVTAKLHPERRKQFRSMSHLVSENKSIYFLTCFAQMKITLFIFVNKWVIWENESFLLVELCSHVPKSRGDGEVSCFFVSFFFFLRLTNDYSRLSSIYPSLALSDFHLPCRFESPSDTPLYAVSEAPPDCKLCSP